MNPKEKALTFGNESSLNRANLDALEEMCYQDCNKNGSFRDYGKKLFLTGMKIRIFCFTGLKIKGAKYDIKTKTSTGE